MDFPRADRPPVVPVFFAFRVMVGIGLALIALGLTGASLWWRRRLFDTRWYLRIAASAWPLGFIAILAGWLTTETGRQPFIIYGVMRTAQAVAPVSAATVAVSLALFVLVYCAVFSMGIYYIHKLIARGPAAATLAPPALPHGLPNRPLSLAEPPAGSAAERAP
jgi:cytochrome d ubiquinol oxidase subunit I